jgi:uncharacterized membrane protein HdeD (DUF308 family)
LRAAVSALYTTASVISYGVEKHTERGDRMVVGVALILLGLLYVWKPSIFRRGVWLKTSVAVRTLSETNYTRYMRGLGIVLIVVGLALVVMALA